MPPIYIGERTVIARYIGSRPVQAVMYRGEEILGASVEPLPYPSTGLIYYLNATDRSAANITQAENKVSAIADKSPAKNATAVQATDTLRPLTNTDTLLGGNALHFKSQDRLLMPAALNSIGAGDFTVYVNYATETPGTAQELLVWSNGVSPVISLAQGAARHDFKFGSAVKVPIANTPTALPRVMAMRRSGGDITGFIDTLKATLSGAVDVTLTGNPRIGGEYSSIGNFVGTIREVMVYNVAHTDAQVAAVMWYLNRAETKILIPPVNLYAPVLWGGNAVGDAYNISDGYWSYEPTSYVKVLKKDGVVVAQPYYKTNGDTGVLTAEVTATNQDGSTMAASNSISADAPYSADALARRNGTNRSQVAGLTNQLSANHAAGGVYVRGEFRNKIKVGRYPLVNPSFVFPNWGVLGGDKTVGNSISIDVYLEDIKSTTLTPITFGGAALKTIAPGANAESDQLSLTLPPFSEFYIRVGVQVPDATGSFYDGTAADPEPGVFSTRLQAASQINALGALVKNSGEASLNFYSYGPVEVLGQLPVGAVSVGCFGDSIGASGFLRLGVENAALGRIPVTDYCRPGEFMQLFVDPASAGYRANCAQYHTHNIFQFGANDLNADFNLSQYQTRYQAGWALLKAQGQKVAQTTIFPRQMSSTDTTPYHANWLPGGVRDQLNAWFLTRVGIDIDAVIDSSALVEAVGNKNAYNPNYTNDGTHLNAAGKLIAAQAVTAWADFIA